MEASSSGRGILTRRVEMVVAAAFVVLAAVVIKDSIRIGRGWDSDGPAAGFYPFYVALLLGGAALSILIRTWRAGSTRQFIGPTELRRVLAMLLPCAAYVGLLLALGIYVASALFLIGFMRFQGKYAWSRALPLGIGVPLAMFATFEHGFGLPLPKGPLEAWFGY